ncbi:enoyl-CoA hydratase/isomerase family protein [Yoonia maritima]|uniref:enoyl-CoA hydratase/isomerase family protein n=1 Tax=Yoonia maritima TaxID=1435347 RepID=UPI000D111A8E|nr:enoyl-CoA hydratase/isomerase family protein [Yoonia maritima]
MMQDRPDETGHDDGKTDTMIEQTLDDGVLILTISAPERRNPIGHPVRQMLVNALAKAENDTEVGAVVLTGAGGHFSAGGDIREMGGTSFAESRDRFSVMKDLTSRMMRFPKPLIAAVEGWAAGAGFSTTLACETIVAATDARFIASFAKIGLIPDMGMLATLPARVGVGRAQQIMLNPTPIDAPRAEAIGMVDHLTDPGSALDLGVSLARTAMQAAPMPRAYIRDFLAWQVDAALEYERQMQPLLARSADAAEGRDAFLAKRAPIFTGN